MADSSADLNKNQDVGDEVNTGENSSGNGVEGEVKSPASACQRDETKPQPISQSDEAKPPPISQSEASNVESEPSTSTEDAEVKGESASEPVTDPYHYTKGEEFTSEIFKIEIKNLPRYFGFSQLKKMLVKLQLNPKKLKAMKGRNGNFGFVTFNCEEDKQKALKVLDGYTWKKSVLNAVPAKPVADPMAKSALKRKQEEGPETDAKKRKESDMPAEHRLNDAVTSLWRQTYAEQLKSKHTSMVEFLKFLTRRTKEQIGSKTLMIRNPSWIPEKHGNMCCPLEDIKPSPVVDGYRNKCEFTIGISPSGEEKTVGFRLGSYKGGQISVVEPSNCLHLSNATKNVVKCFQQYIRDVSKLSGFDPVTHHGHWRMLTVRTNSTGDILGIVVMHPHQLTQDEIVKEKQQLSDFFQSGDGKQAAVSSLFLHQQTSSSRDDDSSQQYDLIFGQPHITENILGLSFRISPDAFFQVNSKAAEVLYKTVAEFAEVNETSTVLDICCGTGTIGISLAKQVNKVIGIEVNQQAINDAVFNAEANGLTNVTYSRGKAEEVLPSITNNLKDCKDVIGIVDPPRAGLAFKVLQAIRRCDNLRRLVYVSCNPHNAIVNFIDLCRPTSNKHKGLPFWPVKAVPVDLFPHTKHCELIILFERELKSTATAPDVPTPSNS
ncbi:tRNA (uracil-5-)-methyltransferase homolog A-like isoform X2 [Amphiura filiformis]|uniref:tRNA (uracil-5-)-methyltransferase homolog A-like isoform X2 n=1 Tax=Amphiura filiformis TaxID=82378 RepID=UPI003B2232D5